MRGDYLYDRRRYPIEMWTNLYCYLTGLHIQLITIHNLRGDRHHRHAAKLPLPRMAREILPNSCTRRAATRTER